MLRTLVAVDHELESNFALRFACNLAQFGDLEVEAVHVLEPLPMDLLRNLGWARSHWNEEQITQAEEEITQLIAGEIESCPMHGKPKIVQGDPVKMILVEAKTGDFDLVVIGAPYRSLSVKPLLGPIQAKVIQKIDRPLVLVKTVRKIQKVLICTDGTSTAEQGLGFIARLFQKGNFSLSLVHVQDTFHGKSRVQAKETLQRGEKLLQEHGLAPELHLLEGDPAKELTTIAKNYDMICIGRYGEAGVKRGIGWVALSILSQCSCPVLIYQPK
jgi:nucleotide-binding universal stress UspA family protein